MGFELDIINLEKRYAYLTALNDINLKVKRGEFITLLGPNGAGKSTLLGILSTLSKPTNGNALISGYDLKQQRNQIRKIIGYISHQNMLYENLTAFENLKFISVFYYKENMQDRCEELLENVGLYSRRNDLVKTFSSGMKQRLAIARSLINSPRILFLDEPYNGLDQNGIDSFSGILSELKDSDHTIILATHNLDEGLELSDRLLVMNKGKIVFDETNKYKKEEFKNIYFSALQN